MRTLATMLMLTTCFTLIITPGIGCASNRSETPGAADSSDRDPAPASESGAASEAPQPEEDAAPTPPRKGTRVTGGFPPIRRADLVSGLRVPAAQRFVLGGGQPSSFYCDVENQGDTTVMVYASRNGGYTVVAKLAPGDSASHRFQPSESAIVANLSTTDEARLRLRVWGDTNLAMEYEPHAD